MPTINAAQASGYALAVRRLRTINELFAAKHSTKDSIVKLSDVIRFLEAFHETADTVTDSR